MFTLEESILSIVYLGRYLNVYLGSDILRKTPLRVKRCWEFISGLHFGWFVQGPLHSFRKSSAIQKSSRVRLQRSQPAIVSRKDSNVHSSQPGFTLQRAKGRKSRRRRRRRMAAECGGECEAEEAGGVAAAALSLRGAARSRHRCVEAAAGRHERSRARREHGGRVGRSRRREGAAAAGAALLQAAQLRRRLTTRRLRAVGLPARPRLRRVALSWPDAWRVRAAGGARSTARGSAEAAARERECARCLAAVLACPTLLMSRDRDDTGPRL